MNLAVTRSTSRTPIWRGQTKSAPGVIGFPQRCVVWFFPQKWSSETNGAFFVSEEKDPESGTFSSIKPTHKNQHDAIDMSSAYDGGEINEGDLEAAKLILDREYLLVTELINAVKKDDLKAVELILHQKKVRVEELHKAIKDGELEAAKFILEQEEILVTELHEAVKEGDLEVAKVIVKEGDLQAAKLKLDQKKKLLKELHKALKEGNLKAAKLILDQNKILVTDIINDWDEIALQVAAYEGHTLIVDYLVGLMGVDDLKRKNSSSDTALNLVSRGNNVDIAEILVKKNKALLDIKGSDGKLPLHMAAVSGNRDMVIYLYKESKRMKNNPLIDETRGLWTFKNRDCVLLACVHAELFDVAQQIVNDFPELAQSEGNILEVLARKCSAFNRKKHRYYYNGYDGYVDEANQAVQFLRTILTLIPSPKLADILRGPADQVAKVVNPEEECQENSADQVMPAKKPEEACQKYSSRVLFVAVENDNTAFVAVLIDRYPKLVLELNDNEQNLFQVAVLYRREGIFNLLRDRGSIKESIINVIDKNGNNLLHLTGIVKETMMSNKWKDLREPTVRMEVEEKWFKMVSDMLSPSLRDMKNEDGETPRELFTKNHEELFFQAVKSEKKAVSRLYSFGVAVIVAVIAFTLNKYYQNPEQLGLPVEAALLIGVVFALGSFTVLSTLMFPYHSQHDFISLRSWAKTILSSVVVVVMLLLSVVAVIYCMEEQYIPLAVSVIVIFLCCAIYGFGYASSLT